MAARLKLTELAPVVVEAFYREEIGVGHALLLAKLQPDQQEQALAACFKEDWSNGGQKAKRILLPVRNLQFWIESNILLILKLAPFDKRDAQLVPAAGSCVDCPKRTGHNKLLFADVQAGRLHRPKLLSREGRCPCCQDHCGETQARANQHGLRPAAGRQRDVAAQQVHRNPAREAHDQRRGDATGVQDVQVHHRSHRRRTASTRANSARFAPSQPARCIIPRSSPQQIADDAKWKAEQEKQRKEAAIANTTGIRILAAITAAVPVRLMKRDLLFVVERLASLLDENRLAVVARQHGIKKAKDSDSIGKLFAAYLRRAEESALGGLLVEITILHAATRQNAAQVLRDAATAYKVDMDAIGLKVKQEFAAKEKARLTAKPPTKAVAKAQPKPAKKAKAA